MNEQKLKEVFSDEAFIGSILDMDTAEEVQKALAEKDVKLSLEEIMAIKNSLGKADEEGELSEDQLEDVTGGSIVAFIAAAACTAFGVAYADCIMRRW